MGLQIYKTECCSEIDGVKNVWAAIDAAGYVTKIIDDNFQSIQEKEEALGELAQFGTVVQGVAVKGFLGVNAKKI